MRLFSADLQDGRSFVGQACTLDGVRASVSGRKLPFGHITALDGSLRYVEFSWPTIARIMAKGGDFRS